MIERLEADKRLEMQLVLILFCCSRSEVLMGSEAMAAANHRETGALRWKLIHRIGFRFCFAYFAMYCIFTQILTGFLPLPNVEIPDLSLFWPWNRIVLWTGAHILRIGKPVVFVQSGSGDKLFDWVLAFSMLLIAALATAAWTALDRKRANYKTLDKWFRLFLRLGLAGQLISYGIDKAIPLQMPYPSLVQMLEAYGNFSPMGVLWKSIGAAPGYEIFAGCAELLAGVLLLFPRTAMLGAFLCLGDMIQVFMLNMTYDVPVKLLSFHLVLLSLYLLAPEFRRVARFFLGEGGVEASSQPALFSTRRANWIALAAQVGLGVWLVGMYGWGGVADWKQYGGGRPRSYLYGIWNVDEYSVDGQVHPPLLTDPDRWQRAVFDSEKRLVFQHMDGTLGVYSAAIDGRSQSILLTKPDDKKWQGKLTFQRATPEQMTLDGTMDGHILHAKLVLMDKDKLLLPNRGFHWVQERPFNR